MAGTYANPTSVEDADPSKLVLCLSKRRYYTCWVITDVSWYVWNRKALNYREAKWVEYEQGRRQASCFGFVESRPKRSPPHFKQMLNRLASSCGGSLVRCYSGALVFDLFRQIGLKTGDPSCSGWTQDLRTSDTTPWRRWTAYQENILWFSNSVHQLLTMKARIAEARDLKTSHWCLWTTNSRSEQVCLGGINHHAVRCWKPWLPRSSALLDQAPGKTRPHSSRQRAFISVRTPSTFKDWGTELLWQPNAVLSESEFWPKGASMPYRPAKTFHASHVFH